MVAHPEGSLFDDRRDAGRQLAGLLQHLQHQEPMVLALPRGGVPVAFEIARLLGAPLEVLVVRKLGAPGQPELGLGAVAEGGARFVDPALVSASVGLPDELAEIEERESAEVVRRALLYRGGRPLPAIEGRTVILVDDGVATGGTARAALRALEQLRPRRVVLAVPVMAAAAARELRRLVDELVYLRAPEEFWAVGRWYRRFAQTTDDEVVALLRASHP